MAGRVALGFRVHLGWAAGVAVAGGRAKVALLWREKLVLTDPTVRASHEPYHKAAELLPDFEAARGLVHEGTKAVRAATRKSVRAWLRELRAQGFEPTKAIVLLSSGRDFPLESVLRSHAMIHSAEGALCRDALQRACHGAKIAVAGVRERDLWGEASRRLKIPEAACKKRVDDLGAGEGPPWRQDQKLAAAAAWLSLS